MLYMWLHHQSLLAVEAGFFDLIIQKLLLQLQTVDPFEVHYVMVGYLCEERINSNKVQSHEIKWNLDVV